MKSIGIICEYNPFHNGHLYHIEKVKELYPDYRIILVMSGNFTQRGLVSVLNKWDKTEIALEYGVDLVIELPFVFATQSADIFAKGSISLLSALKVEKLVFGSETDDINKLITLAHIQLEHPKYDAYVRQYLNEGLNYPTAMSKALTSITGNTVTTPNDLLGLSYIKEIIKQKSNIEPITIERTNNFHSLNLENNIVSASAIREALKNNVDVTNYIPKKTKQYLNNDITTDKYFSFLKYKIISDNKKLDDYQTVDEGLVNRIQNIIHNTDTLEQFIQEVKTKRYTYNKLLRMAIHILCSFTKEEASNNQNISYIRILGMNNYGREYLNKIKKEISIPVITACNKIKDEMLEIELRSTYIYTMALDKNIRKEIIKKEFSKKPIIKEN